MAIDVVWLSAQKRTGVTIQAESLVEALDSREGFDVDLVFADPVQTSHNSTFITDEDGGIYPVRSVVETIESISPDVIVLHHLSEEVIRSIDVLKEMAVIVTRVGVNLRELLFTDSSDHSRIGDFAHTFQMSDLIVASSPRTASDVESMGIGDSRIVCIPSGVVVDEDDVVQPSEDMEYAVGSIGRLGRVKNQFTLVQAVTMFREFDVDRSPKYILAGTPNDRSWEGVEEFSRQIAPSVQMESRGWVNDPYSEFFSDIDVHLHPSWTENCPVNLLESAVVGVPSVVSDLGWQSAYPEIDFPTAQPDDPEEWAVTVRELYENPEELVSLATEQQEAVLDHYTMADIVPQYVDEIERAFDKYAAFKLDDVDSLRQEARR